MKNFEGTNLHVEIPPAEATRTHQHIRVLVPPEVISAEQHTPLLPKDDTDRACGVTWRGEKLQTRGDHHMALTLQDPFRFWCGIGITSVDPALAAKNTGPLCVIGHVIPMGQHDRP